MIFGIKKNMGQYNINILGLKIKIRPLKLRVKQLETQQYQLKRELTRCFGWLSKDKFTINDRVRRFSQNIYTHCGYYPNIKNPKSLNEKINWLRLNYKYPVTNHKYFVKDYINNILGEGYTPKVYAYAEDISDISFDKLPDQFVIKTTHGSSGAQVILVRDKSKCDIEKLKYECSVNMCGWCNSVPNDNIGILVEEYIEEVANSPNDYKFYCFNGEPKFFYISKSYVFNNDKTITFYDMNFNKAPFSYNNRKQDKAECIEKPRNFDKMMEIAKKLSKGIPFVRIDLYNLKSKIYVGEITFFPSGGYGKYSPIEWDYKMGDMIDLKSISPSDLEVLPGFEEAIK